MKKNPQRLCIFTAKHVSTVKQIGVVDLETDGFGGALIAGAYQTETMPEPIIFTTIADWLVYAESVAPSVIWYAHNASGFDLKYILTDPAYLERAASGWSAKVICSGQNIVLGVKIEWQEEHREQGKHRRKLSIQIRDSMKLAPMSLEKFTKAFAPDLVKMSGTINFNGGERFDLANPDHVAYLNQDVSGLLAALVNFSGMIRQHFGVSVGWTLPATAYRAWTETLERPVFQPPPFLRDFCRRAYYGGMVRPGKVQASHATHLDRNSAYPAIMKEDLPIGGGFKTGTEYLGYLPGFYHIWATVPQDTKFTILPQRTAQGVVFPTGTFDTWCSSEEITLALELGQEIEVIEGYAFTLLRPICKKFVEMCESLRHQDYSGPLGQIAKLIQNALYGKFGTRELTHTISYGACPSDGAQMISQPGSVLPLWSKDDTKNVAQIQPHIAAWITARQRVELARAILATGVDDFVYCDTDSLVTTCEKPELLLAVGSEYGQWKVEAKDADIVVAAPKTYAERVAGQKDKVVAKGLPIKKLTYDMIARATTGERLHVEFLSSIGLLTVLKGGKHEFFQTSTRALPTPTSSLGWTMDGAGYYHPIDWDLKVSKAIMRGSGIRWRKPKKISHDRADELRREELVARLRGR